MNLRLKAAIIVASAFAGCLLGIELIREYNEYFTTDLFEYFLIGVMVYCSYRYTVLALEAREDRNRARDVFPDEKV
jgi:hypothetical protein